MNNSIDIGITYTVQLCWCCQCQFAILHLLLQVAKCDDKEFDAELYGSGPWTLGRKAMFLFLQEKVCKER